MASEPIVRCASCNRPLPEPANTPMDERKPCRWRGGMSRTYDVTLTATVTTSFGTDAQTTKAQAASTGLEDAGYEVTWLRLSEGGAWMVRVYDRQGRFVGGSIQNDPESAILAVAEDLLPPAQ